MSCVKIIMVGGRSGVGKTTLINSLLKYSPELYERPKSFTSRKRRLDEGLSEYHFVTRECMEQMKQNGEFANFDYVYGNYYAMTISSLAEIGEAGKLAIKEIHPSNQKKLKEAYPESIAVLIKEAVYGSNNSARRERREEDDTFYNAVNEEWFDIIFTYDKNISLRENCYYFNMKLFAFLKHRERFPIFQDIDALNLRGYSLIAKEFTEAKRITTHNFHTLSLSFFQNVTDSLLKDGDSVLEVGPGQGWLRRNCHFPAVCYDVLELTKEMTQYVQADEIVVSSVSRTELPSQKYQMALASLADPYFYPEAICEICRVIKPNGYFAFSLPAAEWAKGLRGDKIEMTAFRSQTGQEVKTYSFVLEIDELRSLLEDCGFNVLRLETINGEQLAGEFVSPAITNVTTDVNKLGIVTVGLCEKRSAYNE